ncbi:MAG TPA: hypothetical protein VGI47_06105 [Candidatus Binataceae bacterium]
MTLSIIIACSSHDLDPRIRYLVVMPFAARPSDHLGVLLVLANLLASVGCYAPYYVAASEGHGTETSVGEEHEVDLPASDSFVMSQDVLRAEGILFEVKPNETVDTFWEDTGLPVSGMANFMGVKPQYRYEIQTVAVSPSRSRVVANVQGRDMTDAQITAFKAGQKFDFFNKLDRLVAQAPASTVPASGGVNYALLPSEDLKGLAKRVTGNPSNWQQIAKDNGLSSPDTVPSSQTIWVRNSLLKKAESAKTSP